jgi:glycosyltransferase involved in cell wall biosynthesis
VTPRRIHVVAWRDRDDPEAGGSEKHINELARRWAAAGVDVTLRTGAVAGGAASIERDGYRVVRRGGAISGLVRSPLSEVLRRQGRADALVEVWHGINFLSPLWWRGPRVGIAHHVHGEQFRYVLPGPAAALAELLERRISPKVYRRTPLVTLSPSTRAELLELGYPPANVHVSPPGVDERFSPGGRRAAHPVVLSVGRLMPQKRVDLLISALTPVQEVLPDLELVVVGTGPDDARLRSAAPPWVTFAGRVGDDELVEHYRAAWVVASASVAEGWNMTITEGGACATPAVASRIAGHVDAIVDGETGFLATGGPELTTALERILTDAGLRAGMGEAARRHAAAFTWDAAAQTVLDVLDEGIRPSPSPRGTPPRR